MITTKQRSNLRRMAHNLTPVVIVGKEGVTEQVLKSINDVLEARELIKIRLLNNCSLTTREVSTKVCEALDAEGVQCIGSIVVVYKRSSKKDVVHIEI